MQGPASDVGGRAFALRRAAQRELLAQRANGQQLVAGGQQLISGTAYSGDSSYKEGLTGWVATISRGRDGDHINAVLAVAGYNFSLYCARSSGLLRTLIRALLAVPVWLQTA